MSIETVISSLGTKGDGIAEVDGARLHVQFALPGERVEIEVFGNDALLLGVIEPSKERLEPFCPHFGTCGGCRMQHAGPAIYEPWKRDIVVSALRNARIDAPVAALVAAHGTGRRRVTLHIRFERRKAQAGFMAARSHLLIDLETCPVLTPALAKSPDIARALAQPFESLGKPLDVQITDSANGLDVDIRGSGEITPALRLLLSQMAGRLDLARLSLHGEVIVERRAPFHRMGLSMVTPPPGGFLQATAAGEEALGALVHAAVGKAKRVADLFCGVGPFALRLATKSTVFAADFGKDAIGALDRGWRGTTGLRQIRSEARDLFRRPLLAHELAEFDAIVLDPPRAGAEAQVRQLALTKSVPLVVYVSCDPQSFARDASVLISAGYVLENVTPVDQFAWSAHVELVGVFRLAGKGGKRR